MSSTNKTTNYELSQFVGTDKPAWLTDYNQDMSKIDTGIHAAQSTATGAEGKADANTNNIGDMSYLSTTAKNTLVAAINEIDSNTDTATGIANTASTTANTAASNANTALEQVDDLASYLSLTPTIINPVNLVAASGTINTSNSNLTIAKNAAGTFGKIYGIIRHNVTTPGDQTVTLNQDSGIHPTSDITISPAGLGFLTTSGMSADQAYAHPISITVKPNGTLVFKYYADRAGLLLLNMLPCAYFFENFGDQPE